MSPFSLRARLLMGALLWTTGLFALAGVILNFVMFRHPGAPKVLHATFSHGPLTLLFALACMVLGLLHVRRGVSPLNRLRARLASVRAGREPRLDGQYPAEVQPLVDDLNGLLDDRERRVTRAMGKAGDLAHGLKTPLAVLAHEARLLAGAGHADAAATIDQQIDRMRKQIDYHLAHARASASGAASSARTPVAESVEGLCRALFRLASDRGSSITVDNGTDAAHLFRGQREDLDEMLGNLLDNAFKWARSQIAVSSAMHAGMLTITIDDDGPGIDPSMRALVLQRGVRADEASPGSGLGLAIVCDLAEVYGGTVALSASPAGGLRARLQLPGGESGAA
ncbi:MAG: sensor histidine kinase [Acidobacteriota bacterium]|nr:sensor histidine kinase [Acidobacteriota bacterium]